MIDTSKNSKLISVLLPLFNESIEHATLAIESVLQQSYRNIELLVGMDDPSNKDLLAAIESIIDNRLVIVRNEKNVGLVENLNGLISIAGGYYIARMDGDDICLPNRLEISIRQIEAYGVDIVAGAAIIIDPYGEVSHIYSTAPESTNCSLIPLLIARPFIHPTWMAKAIVFRSLGYRDYDRSEDYDFLCRAYLSEYKIRYCDQPFIKYRLTGGGLSRTKYKVQLRGVIESNTALIFGVLGVRNYRLCSAISLLRYWLMLPSVVCSRMAAGLLGERLGKVIGVVLWPPYILGFIVLFFWRIKAGAGRYKG